VTEPLTAEELPVVQALVAQIVDLEQQLRAEREVSDHWRSRAQTADRRIADLETERFAR
jgi:hypothetical protein